MLPSNPTSVGFTGNSEEARSNVLTQGDPTQRTRTTAEFTDDVSLEAFDWIKQQRFLSQLLPATVGEDVWPGGGPYPFLLTADNLLIPPGGNPADTAGGAGAQEIEIVGVDADWNPITELLATAGAGPSALTSAKFLRVNFVRVTKVGTFHSFEFAPIPIITTIGTLLSIVIFGESRNGIFSVPKGFTGVFDKFVTTIAGLSQPQVGTRSGVLSLQAAEVPDLPSTFGVLTLFTQLPMVNKAIVNHVLDIPYSFKERTDVWQTLITDETTGGTTQVVMAWTIRLYRNI